MSVTKSSTKSLISKLVAACKKIEPVQMKGKNENLDYPYLRIHDLAEALRIELLKRQVLFFPEDGEPMVESWDQTDGKRWHYVWLATTFTITDGNASIKYRRYGAGLDFDGKALAIAQTCALKSFLKCIGLVFGEYDDPEATREELKDGARFPREANRLAAYRRRAYHAAVLSCGKPAVEIERYLTQEFGFEVDEDKIVALEEDAFNNVIKLVGVLGEKVLTEKLTASVQHIDRVRSNGKAQPVVATLDGEKEIGAD